jgi:negative regulator of sigma F NrsF-like protein
MTDARALIARDLEPVRPLRPPLVRALALVPLAAAIMLAVPLLHFFRPDLRAIGLVRAWGFSIGQSLAGTIVVAAALRESIPGRGLSRAALVWTFGVGLAVPAALLVLTASTFDVGPGPSHALRDGVVCFRASAIGAVPALVASAMLVARAFPLRPAVAGALYGLGCGLIADAGLRLFCEFSQPQHVLLAHGGAMAVSVTVGALLATLAARR